MAPVGLCIVDVDGGGGGGDAHTYIFNPVSFIVD